MKKLFKILLILGFAFNIAATEQTETDCEAGHDQNRCVDGNCDGAATTQEKSTGDGSGTATGK